MRKNIHPNLYNFFLNISFISSNLIISSLKLDSIFLIIIGSSFSCFFNCNFPRLFYSSLLSFISEVSNSSSILIELYSEIELSSKLCKVIPLSECDFAWTFVLLFILFFDLVVYVLKLHLILFFSLVLPFLGRKLDLILLLLLFFLWN